MDEPKMTVTTFVRGLTWHDMGKPFAQENWRHARLGYWLLWRAGYKVEALVALRHDRGVRNQYFAVKGSGASVPAITMLANALDRLAASIYSFQPQPYKTSHHSLQNPFSRLPIIVDLEKGGQEKDEQRFVVDDEQLKVWEKDLWATKLPDPWAKFFSVDTKTHVEDKNEPLPVDMDVLPDGEAALRRLATALDIYPERTYPPVNDTSLRQHGRLAGILGFVVYRNLEQDQRIDVNESMTRDYRGHFQNHEQLVQTHLDAYLIRITFTSIKSQVQGAARVDDLHGGLMLARDFCEAFKDALAEQLSAPDLAEWLPVSESEFDLVYLLPGEKTDLRETIRQAYAQARSRVVAGILDGRLGRDFPEIKAYRDKLEHQLSTLAYGVHVIPVMLPDEQSFDAFAAAYGRNLLAAYTASQRDGPTDLPITDTDIAPLPASETCEVCGTHPILTPPEGDDENRSQWLRKRNHAAHIFRGEREQICFSCVARRTLAHGAIAKRMDELTHGMFEPVQGKPGMWRQAQAQAQPQDGRPLPPQMGTTVQLTTPEELLDITSFYVRFRRTAGGVDRTTLDLFPTTSYAADKYGNVVLLTLQPTSVLYKKYVYKQALVEWKDRATDDDGIKGWQQTFVAFYYQQKTEHPSFAQTIEWVEPHLARVMERIQWIKRLYAALEDALIAERVRVLPLDVEFPTLRLLLPADQLDQALRVLDQVVTESLFSATYHEDTEARREAHEFLKLVLPDLLHGAVVLFKQKFPLYLALEAERDILHQLAASDPDEPIDQRTRPGNSQWYGFRLGFSDLRGSLSEVGPLHAEATYENLGQVLDLVDKVDRRTVLQYKQTAEYISLELAQAQAMVRTRRVRGLNPTHVKAFSDEEDDLFKPVHFIKRAIRR
jgi:hypothetical protein